MDSYIDGGRPARSFSLDMVGGHHYIRIESQDGAWVRSNIWSSLRWRRRYLSIFSPAPPYSSKLSMSQETRWPGQIYIDGEDPGTDSERRRNLRVPVGVHTFEVRAQGYSYVLKANVAAAANGPLAIQLRR